MNRQSITLTLSLLALGACHPNQYSTPRTVPKGETSHTVSLEASAPPAIPLMTYMVRRGLADRVDMGVQFSFGAKADVKWNIVRTQYFDFSLDPTIGVDIDFWQYTDGPFFAFGALPAIIGVNLIRRVTLVLHGGPGLSNAKELLSSEDQPGLVFTPRFGAGIQVRITDFFYMQPELSVQYISGGPTIATLGLGFGFGPQPSYDPPAKTASPSKP